MDICITGLGLITPLGGNCDETFDALIAGRFIENEARAKFAGGQGGNVNDLAIAAARQAIAHAGWNKWPEDAAIIAGTSKGDIESWLAAMDQQQTADQKQSAAVPRPSPSPSPELNTTFPWGNRFGLGDVAAVLARDLSADPHCIRLTYSAACASGLHALARAVMLIRSGEARTALVVAAESSLHPLFRGCFARLGVLAPPDQPCRPFDLNRHGFHISQAAAAVCIERNPTGGSQPLAIIDQAILAGDAWHLTGADPDARTLRRLLRGAVGGRPVDLVHAHGTGTVANDAIELAALESVLPDATPLPILYSHKAALGHSLGASGLVSVVINCMMHQRGLIPGNVCTTNPLPTEKVLVPIATATRSIQRSLTLASGFGGPVSVIGLRSP